MVDFLYLTDCMFLSCQVWLSEWITLYSCLNFKELLARNRCEIWSLNDRNGTRNHNHLVRKRTLNYLAKLTIWPLGTKWLWVPVPFESLKLHISTQALITGLKYCKNKSSFLKQCNFKQRVANHQKNKSILHLKNSRLFSSLLVFTWRLVT